MIAPNTVGFPSLKTSKINQTIIATAAAVFETSIAEPANPLAACGQLVSNTNKKNKQNSSKPTDFNSHKFSKNKQNNNKSSSTQKKNLCPR